MLKRKYISTILFSLCLLLLAIGCLQDKGSISGMVTNLQGIPLANAAITTDPGNYTAITNASGKYLMNDIPVKSYMVIATLVNSTGSVTVNVKEENPMSCDAIDISNADIQLNVPGSHPSILFITCPSSGATIMGTISIIATANNDYGINRVDYCIDDVNKNTDTTSQYCWDWNKIL
jgi:hypothetical protein